MATILSIDTATSIASVSIAVDGQAVGRIINEDQKEHASFLQPSIKKLIAGADMRLQDVDAVAVVNGPGSYTGLRVGLASAKGICYALEKPLICLSSLEVMALSALLTLENDSAKVPFLCPMMDARRMEVFTALYNSSLKEIIFAQAMVLNEESFVAELLQNKILFFGNGAEKFKNIQDHPNALFAGTYDSYAAISSLAFQKFNQLQFSELAYSEPFYLKDFFNK